ncbi:hypothetical protein ANCCEY_06904 [Ancylostoma ceylanicum]|uniref:Uncharacterized protein n=1 Tax=Ancylostoma ceylanicum TaxID=53326 RepID=A0A0D6LS43_9BILA|nr:hypothetical protein ANCCEY_06904 [Ancylostoma ceylanicum]
MQEIRYIPKEEGCGDTPILVITSESGEEDEEEEEQDEIIDESGDEVKS